MRRAGVSRSEDAGGQNAGTVNIRLCLVDTQSGKGVGGTGVWYSDSHYDNGRLLTQMGLYSSKARKMAYEQCPKKVQKWLDEEYPAIKAQAKQEKAEIYWGDETGVKNQCHH